MKHPGHSHPHLHPHRRGVHHHHPHHVPPYGLKGRHSRIEKQFNLAHHHPIPKRQRPRRPYCTDRIAAIWQEVYRWFPHAVNMGTFNCRRVAGSQAFSEHAWGDAWDVSSPGTIKSRPQHPDAYLDQIVGFIRQLPPKLRISQILFRDGDSHENHAHVDVEPNFQGTPPCAQQRR